MVFPVFLPLPYSSPCRWPAAQVTGEDKAVLSTYLSISHDGVLTGQWRLSIKTNSEQFTKVTFLNHIRFYQGLQDSLPLLIHLGMTAHNMLPSFLGQANGYPI